MRSHLFKYLEEEEFTLFSISHKHTKLSKGYIIYVDIYFIIKSLFYEENSERDEYLFMVKYAKCGQWYHKICLKIRLRVFSSKSVE